MAVFVHHSRIYDRTQGLKYIDKTMMWGGLRGWQGLEHNLFDFTVKKLYLSEVSHYYYYYYYETHQAGAGEIICFVSA
ncbi:MAG: hypothetical protein DSY43_02110 [Gammaproteobacteria bacterium]|nr:MAG: hypothetical protein DSY43_02110 [Gammaproteobacteria bacterium]